MKQLHSILVGIIGACSSKVASHDGNDTDTAAADSIVAGETVTTPKQGIQAKKEFLETFYQGLDESDLDPSYIKKYITPKALQILKDSYYYDCEGGDCLAIWLFAYEPGSDPGEFLSRRIEEVNENDFRVVTKYELADYVALVTLIEDGDTYKIDYIKQEDIDDVAVEDSFD